MPPSSSPSEEGGKGFKKKRSFFLLWRLQMCRCTGPPSSVSESKRFPFNVVDFVNESVRRLAPFHLDYDTIGLLVVSWPATDLLATAPHHQYGCCQYGNIGAVPLEKTKFHLHLEEKMYNVGREFTFLPNFVALQLE
jgi:hypothetical protein